MSNIWLLVSNLHIVLRDVDWILVCAVMAMLLLWMWKE